MVPPTSKSHDDDDDDDDDNNSSVLLVGLISSSLLLLTVAAAANAVEVFDGSDIVDPIVVSNVFWTSLQTKLVSFVLGQVLAAIVFAMLLSILASQFQNLFTAIFGANDSNNNDLENQNSTRQNNKGLKIPRNLQAEDSTRQGPPPDFGKLLICLAIDIIGTSNEIVPVVGEIADVVWAPIAALLLRSLFGGTGGNNNVLLVLEFAEEILPFTDVLPLATLCWTIETFFADSDLAKLLRIGNYGSTNQATDRRVNDTTRNVVDAIDVVATTTSENRRLDTTSSDRDAQ